MTIKTLRHNIGLTRRYFGLQCGLPGKNITRTVERWEKWTQEPNQISWGKILSLSIEHGKSLSRNDGYNEGYFQGMKDQAEILKDMIQGSGNP